MFNRRQLNDIELKFITKQINNSKNLLLSVFIMLIVASSSAAIIIYSDIDHNNIGINVTFGAIIFLISLIHWVLIGYKKHKINPHVYKSSGTYSRVYVQNGKYGHYYDTLNGYYVKIPWHWRKYLKAHKETVKFEYILRNNTLGLKEITYYYVVSINDELSLDYEIKHGLNKASPLAFIHLLSLLIVLPVALVFSLSNNLDNGLKINQLFKSETKPVVLNSAEDLAQITSANYIEIQNAWVYQFKRPFDYQGDYFVISKTERDRIYNNPSSNYYYRHYFSASRLTKPNKAAFEKQTNENPLRNKGMFKKIPDSIWKKGIDKAFEKKEILFEKQLKRALKTDSIIEVLKPKTTLLTLNKNCFDSLPKPVYSIKRSLKEQTTVYGFYNPKTKILLSFKEQKERKAIIRNSIIPIGISLLVFLMAAVSIIKIIYNSMLKIKLVENQLNINNGNPRLNK